MLSGLVVAGVNAEQTLPYYAVLSTVAVHLTHQVRNMEVYSAVYMLAPKGWICIVQRDMTKQRTYNESVKNMGFLLKGDMSSPLFLDLHIGHSQTRGLLEEICVKPKPWIVAVFRHCRWKSVERKKREFATK